MASFTPSALAHIPPPTLAELRTVFCDIDYTRAGRVPVADVREALAVNRLALRARDVELALGAMQALTAHPGCGSVDCDAFARCVHALSLAQRELLPPRAYAQFPDSDFAGLADGLQLRRAVWLALEDPLSSPAARAAAALIVVVILLSTAAFCIETLPVLHKSLAREFEAIEAACVAVFTVELLLRLTCAPSLRTFCASSLNAVDVLAVVPFYVEVAMLRATGDVVDTSSSTVLRAMRLVRIFRLLKVGRYLAWLRVFGRTLAGSLAPLGMLLYVAVLCVVFVSTLVYYLERGVWDPSAVLVEEGEFSKGGGGGARALALLGAALRELQVAPGMEELEQGTNSSVRGAWVDPDTGRLTAFQSIPATFWWCTITMTGVGYGDVVPRTAVGRLAGACAFFAGIILCAVPISIISGAFHGEYEHMKRMQAIKDTHAAQPAPNGAQPAVDAAAAEETAASSGGAGGGAAPAAAAAAAAAAQPLQPPDGSSSDVLHRIQDSWSEPFLRSAMQVVRNARRKLMAGIKARELVSRELASTEMAELVGDVCDSVLDRGGMIVRKTEDSMLGGK